MRNMIMLENVSPQVAKATPTPVGKTGQQTFQWSWDAEEFFDRLVGLGRTPVMQGSGRCWRVFW